MACFFRNSGPWSLSGSVWRPRNSTTRKGRTDNGKKQYHENAALSIKESSGNVFVDLGFANPEQELLKAKLILQIYRTIRERKLTQTQAGEILGIKQPHVSSLMRGQSGMFSAERLMEFLTDLGHDIEISVSARRRIKSTRCFSSQAVLCREAIMLRPLTPPTLGDRSVCLIGKTLD